MLCPECQQALLVLEFDGVEIDYCSTCGGLWLDAGELGLVLHGQPDASVPVIGPARRGRRPCPLCREAMDVVALAAEGVEVDVCPRRHGWWLDRGELPQLMAAGTMDPRWVPLRDFCTRLFPAGAARG